MKGTTKEQRRKKNYVWIKSTDSNLSEEKKSKQ